MVWKSGGLVYFLTRRKGLGCWLSLAFCKKSNLVVVGWEEEAYVGGSVPSLNPMPPTNFTPTKNACKSCLALVSWMHYKVQTRCKRTFTCLFFNVEKERKKKSERNKSLFFLVLYGKTVVNKER